MQRPLRSALIPLWCALLSVAPLPRRHASLADTVPCAGDFNGDGRVTVDEILTAVNDGLSGCPTTISADQACAKVATANCIKLDQCVLRGTMIRYDGGGICQARQKQACLVRLGAAGTGNNPVEVARCAVQVPLASCDDFDLGDIVQCQAKIGTMPNGAPCAFDGQCQSANCAIVTGTNCGTCASPNQAGDRCATTSCSHGLTCVQSSEQCQLRTDAGGSCDTDHPCSVGLSCVTASGMSSGTCETDGSMGTACDPKRQTAVGCDPNAGLYCDGTTKTCLPVGYAMAGNPCGSVNHAVVVCTDASTCVGAQGQTPGTCVADAPNGMPCDTQSGPSCVPPARCVTGSAAATSGVCAVPDPTMCI